MLNMGDFDTYFIGIIDRNEELINYAFAIDKVSQQLVPCDILTCSRCEFNDLKLRFTTCVAARVAYLYNVMKEETTDEI